MGGTRCPNCGFGIEAEIRELAQRLMGDLVADGVARALVQAFEPHMATLVAEAAARVAPDAPPAAAAAGSAEVDTRRSTVARRLVEFCAGRGQTVAEAVKDPELDFGASAPTVLNVMKPHKIVREKSLFNIARALDQLEATDAVADDDRPPPPPILPPKRGRWCT